MRALVRLIAALVVLALTSCGGGDEQNRAKQSTISAEAYPAVEKFLTSGVPCEKLADVSRQDRIAHVVAKTCTEGQAFVQSTKVVSFVITRCIFEARARPATVLPLCIADRGHPLMRKTLRDFEHLAKTYNSELEEVVKPGACLAALKLRESVFEAIGRARDELPAAIRRVRSGDITGLERIIRQLDIRRDPKPCRP